MGLSDGERIEGVYNALARLNKIRNEWLEAKVDSWERRKYANIFALIEKTWPIFLASQSNGLHWIMGSASSNAIINDEACDPWSIAIKKHLEYALEPEDSCRLHIDLDSPDKPFDAKKFTNIASLVRTDEVSFSYIFQLHQWVEQLIYYVRRYDDELRSGLKALDDIIGQLLGEFYVVFRDNEVFGKAYIITQIMEILYGPRYPYNEDEYDLVTKWLVKQNSHHDLSSLTSRRQPTTIKKLATIHANLVKDMLTAQYEFELNKDKIKTSLQNAPIHIYHQHPVLLKSRLFAVIELTHSQYAYKHIYKEFVAAVKEAKLDYQDEVLAALEKGQKEYDASKVEAEDKFGWDSYELKALNVYGYDGYSQLNDHFKAISAEKPKEEKKKKSKKKSKKKGK